MTMGNDPDVTLNPKCVTHGTMLDGGWYLCLTSMIGNTFGVYTTQNTVDNTLNFNELMAYSQEAIQMNAGVTVSYLGTNNDSLYPVSNAL